MVIVFAVAVAEKAMATKRFACFSGVLLRLGVSHFGSVGHYIALLCHK
jgi:hypothetical protein